MDAIDRKQKPPRGVNTYGHKNYRKSVAAPEQLPNVVGAGVPTGVNDYRPGKFDKKRAPHMSESEALSNLKGAVDRAGGPSDRLKPRRDTNYRKSDAIYQGLTYKPPAGNNYAGQIERFKALNKDRANANGGSRRKLAVIGSGPSAADQRNEQIERLTRDVASFRGGDVRSNRGAYIANKNKQLLLKTLTGAAGDAEASAVKRANAQDNIRANQQSSREAIAGRNTAAALALQGKREALYAAQNDPTAQLQRQVAIGKLREQQRAGLNRELELINRKRANSMPLTEQEQLLLDTTNANVYGNQALPTEGFADGGLIEGFEFGGMVEEFAQGGPVAAVGPTADIGEAPQAADLQEVAQEYGQYAAAATESGLQPIAMNEYIDLLQQGQQLLQQTPGAAAEGFSEGGEVGAIPVGGQQVIDPAVGYNDSGGDTIPAVIDGQRPAALKSGEFVIPPEVVRAKGTEFFEKLIAQYNPNTE